MGELYIAGYVYTTECSTAQSSAVQSVLCGVVYLFYPLGHVVSVEDSEACCLSETGLALKVEEE